MTTHPNHPAEDALAQLAVLVKSRIEYAVDQIGGNTPSINDGNADQLYDDNSEVLDDLDELVKRVIELAAPHCSGTHYTDGRPVRSQITLPDGAVFNHLWPADPTKATEERIELPSRNGTSVVTITPPSTVTVDCQEPTADLRAVAHELPAETETEAEGTDTTPAVMLVDDDGAPLAMMDTNQMQSDAIALAYDMARHSADDDALDEVSATWINKVGPDAFGYVAAGALRMMTHYILDPTLQTVDKLAPGLKYRTILDDAYRNATDGAGSDG